MRRLFVLAAAFGSLVAACAVLGVTQASAATAKTAKDRVTWRKAMLDLKAPAGCSKASYPRIAWKGVACVNRQAFPFPPAEGPRPFTVGNGVDYVAEVTGLMSAAEGTFENVTGVTSESGQKSGGATLPNAYSLQLNARPFATAVCSPNPACRGWQQFIYSSRTMQAIFMQYWLIDFRATGATTPACPAGWNTYGAHCYRNSPTAAVAVQPISDLSNMQLSGSATASQDTVKLFTSTTSATASSATSLLGLRTAWKAVEFAIVGDCCGYQANFNAGSTIDVRTAVHGGTPSAPICALEGYTGETNNLSLVASPTLGIGASPSIVSRQSDGLASVPSCSSASGVGDTHLTTFRGLLYDFQASGDFTLAKSGPDFEVQTQQVSGAPNWPNASVNRAIGTRMGKTRVAVCLPNRLEVDGQATTVKQGSPLVLPDGVDISRNGTTYLIRGPRGDSVRAEVNNGWINVFVGLGRRPTGVSGLLANANGNVNQLVTAGGTVLTTPLSFSELYGRYGDSWRVKQGESLMCGADRVKPGKPSAPFDVSDLKAAVAKRARAVCTNAGVKRGPLLDACTLDVAVLGRRDAAKVFVGAAKPRAVAITRPRNRE